MCNEALFWMGTWIGFSNVSNFLQGLWMQSLLSVVVHHTVAKQKRLWQSSQLWCQKAGESVIYFSPAAQLDGAGGGHKEDKQDPQETFYQDFSAPGKYRESQVEPPCSTWAQTFLGIIYYLKPCLALFLKGGWLEGNKSLSVVSHSFSLFWGWRGIQVEKIITI
jgi:hypothetical protein